MLHALAHAFRTELGWFAIATVDGRVAALTFGHATPAQARTALESLAALPRWNQGSLLLSESHAKTPPSVAAAIKLLTAYSAGENVDLRKINLFLPDGTEFQRAVVQTVRKLSSGQTLSYGDVAEKSGYAGAARGVGTVMSQNVLPLLIPCHRVLGAQGKLGGYSAPTGLAMKEHLLKLEGCDVAIPAARGKRRALSGAAR